MENKLSIVIPVYNDKENLENVLTALVTQKINLYPETEIIVINDNSTDGLDLSNFGETVRVINMPKNSGCAAARNAGIAAATGKYLTFVDSDDMILDHYLHLIYQTVRNTNCAYSIHNWQVNGNTAKTEMSFKEKPTEISHALWTYVFDRKKVNIPQFNESLIVGSDIAFLDEIFKNQYEYSTIDTPIYNYNLNNVNSLTSRYNRGEITREKKIETPKIIKSKIITTASKRKKRR